MPNDTTQSPTHKAKDDVKHAVAEDYSENMFRDGHNRAENDPKIRNAPDYDRVAHGGKRNADADA